MGSIQDQKQELQGKIAKYQKILDNAQKMNGESLMKAAKAKIDNAFEMLGLLDDFEQVSEDMQANANDNDDSATVLSVKKNHAANQTSSSSDDEDDDDDDQTSVQGRNPKTHHRNYKRVDLKTGVMKNEPFAQQAIRLWEDRNTDRGRSFIQSQLQQDEDDRVSDFHLIIAGTLLVGYGYYLPLFARYEVIRLTGRKAPTVRNYVQLDFSSQSACTTPVAKAIMATWHIDDVKERMKAFNHYVEENGLDTEKPRSATHKIKTRSKWHLEKGRLCYPSEKHAKPFVEYDRDVVQANDNDEKNVGLSNKRRKLGDSEESVRIEDTSEENADNQQQQPPKRSLGTLSIRLDLSPSTKKMKTANNAAKSTGNVSKDTKFERDLNEMSEAHQREYPDERAYALVKGKCFSFFQHESEHKNLKPHHIIRLMFEHGWVSDELLIRWIETRMCEEITPLILSKGEPKNTLQRKQYELITEYYEDDNAALLFDFNACKYYVHRKITEPIGGQLAVVAKYAIGELYLRMQSPEFLSKFGTTMHVPTPEELATLVRPNQSYEQLKYKTFRSIMEKEWTNVLKQDPSELLDEFNLDMILAEARFMKDLVYTFVKHRHSGNQVLTEKINRVIYRHDRVADMAETPASMPAVTQTDQQNHSPPTAASAALKPSTSSVPVQSEPVATTAASAQQNSTWHAHAQEPIVFTSNAQKRSSPE